MRWLWRKLKYAYYLRRGWNPGAARALAGLCRFCGGLLPPESEEMADRYHRECYSAWLRVVSS